MNKFIILGCGYLGTNFANYIAKSIKNKVFVLGIENEYTDYLDKNITFVSKMIEQISSNDSDMFRDSIVIDAVGNINATADSKQSTAVFLNNCAGKVNLIQKLYNFSIKKYVFLSSGGTVYDDSDKPHKEEEKLNPKSVYALEKTIVENYLKIYNLENNKFNYLILRLANPYGGITSKTKKQGIIDVAKTKLLKNEELEIFGELSNVRDYIYIENLCEYIYRLAIGNYENEIFNVGTGIGNSIYEIFKCIEEIYGCKLDFKKNNTIKATNINTNILDVSKLKNSIKIRKIYTVYEGIYKDK